MDSLSKVLDDARHNEFAAFVNLPADFRLLSDLDSLFSLMINNLNHSPEFFAGFFLTRTRSSFIAASRMALCGQIAEAHMVLRGCLESALYGHFVAFDQTRQEIWLRRHDDADGMKRVKKEFTVRSVMDHLKSVDQRTWDITQKLYDLTIDYGAHPNERSLTSQIMIEKDESRYKFSSNPFSLGDLFHHACLKTAARIGVCCLDIFGNVFRARYQLLAIDTRLDVLRQGL
jgi:hypothetical protein